MLTREEKLTLAARLRLGEGCDPPSHMQNEYYANDHPGWYSGGVEGGVWEEWVLGVMVYSSPQIDYKPMLGDEYSVEALLAYLEKD